MEPRGGLEDFGENFSQVRDASDAAETSFSSFMSHCVLRVNERTNVDVSTICCCIHYGFGVVFLPVLMKAEQMTERLSSGTRTWHRHNMS